MPEPSTSAASGPAPRGTRVNRKRARSPETETRPISPLPARGLRPRRPAPVRTLGTRVDSENEDTDNRVDDSDDDVQDFMNIETDSDESDEDRQVTQPRRKGKGRQTGSNGQTSATTKAKKHRTVPLDTQAVESHQETISQLRIENYNSVSLNWTDLYITQLLASREDIVNSRSPSKVLSEAQALQARYRRQKKLLCLIGHISEHTLDAELYVFLLFLFHLPSVIRLCACSQYLLN